MTIETASPPIADILYEAFHPPGELETVIRSLGPPKETSPLLEGGGMLLEVSNKLSEAVSRRRRS
jgi:hypothetical protein